MPPTKIVPSPYGDVELGAFSEVLSIPGRYLNDHCLIRHADLWHMFGITGSVDDPTRRETSFAHATSPDLQRWEIQSNPLQATGAWPEDMGIIAPYVIEHQGRFFMYYSGVDQWTIQRLCLATSHDLYTWDRYPGNPIIVPSLSWSRWPGYGLPTPVELGVSAPEMGGPGRRNFSRQFGGTYGGCRDPHVLQLDDGTFAIYWVSRLQEKLGHNRVCVAASISPDLIHWQESARSSPPKPGRSTRSQRWKWSPPAWSARTASTGYSSNTAGGPTTCPRRRRSTSRGRPYPAWDLFTQPKCSTGKEPGGSRTAPAIRPSSGTGNLTERAACFSAASTGRTAANQGWPTSRSRRLASPAAHRDWQSAT